MDLQDFVSMTLTQIISGVKSAQTAAHEHGGVVNPCLNSGTVESGKQGFLWCKSGYAQVVQFDVALTVTEGTGSKAGIGVFAGAVNLGAAGQSKSEQSTVSRIKFAVPLILPEIETEEKTK